jgi:hypothetical protein
MHSLFHTRGGGILKNMLKYAFIIFEKISRIYVIVLLKRQLMSCKAYVHVYKAVSFHNEQYFLF